MNNSPMKKISRPSKAGLSLLLVLLVNPPIASADDRRMTLLFRPAAATAPFSAEITAGSRRSIALPSLTLTGDRSGLRLQGYTTQLPAVTVRGVSLAPRYGDQRLAFEFQPSALAGMALSPRAVRGLIVTAAGKSFAGTMLVGRLSTDDGTSLLGSAVPRVFALSGTLKPTPKLAISPRLVAPLGQPAAGARIDPTLGVGLRAEVSPHVSLFGDLGRTRARSGRWGQLAAAGALGRWSRVSFEASASRADDAFTVLGPVPFAAMDRKLASTRVLLLRGVTVEGQVSRLQPISRSRRADGTLARSTTLRTDRVPGGSLILRMDRSTASARRAGELTIEWRARKSSGLVLQWQQHSSGSGSAIRRTHRFQVGVPTIPTGSARIVLGLESSMRLSSLSRTDSRITTKIKGRVAAGARIGLTGEAEFGVLGIAKIRRLGAVRVGADIALSRGASIQLVHTHTAGNTPPLWKRTEVRFTRTLPF